MGNCMEALSRQQDEEEEEETTTIEEERGEKKGGIRIKVVLRKEELQWLMEQINEREGKGLLEELLEEIERGRNGGKKVVNFIEEEEVNNNNNNNWRPSLESIMECPEVFDQMER